MLLALGRPCQKLGTPVDWWEAESVVMQWWWGGGGEKTEPVIGWNASFSLVMGLLKSARDMTMTTGICFLAVLEQGVLGPKGYRDGPWSSSLRLSCYPVLNELLLSTSSMHSEKLWHPSLSLKIPAHVLFRFLPPVTSSFIVSLCL